MSLVTVLIPTIGRLNYFDETVASVERQTLSDIDVLVLDNGSHEVATDRFADWARRDPRVRVTRSDVRLPMFTNFKRGISEATTKYVAFFHDDDVYRGDFLETLVRGLEKHPTTGFAGSNFQFIDTTGSVIGERKWIKNGGLTPGRTYIEQLIRRGRNLIPMSGLVFAREMLCRHFDESLSIHFGDFVLLMTMAEDSDLYLSTECLVQIRRHSEQASESVPFSRGIPMRTQILLGYCDQYLDRHPMDRAFIRSLRRRVQLLHRVGLTWGWVTATSMEEARACTRGLGETIPDKSLRTVLDAFDATHVRELLRNRRLRHVAQQFGAFLGI